MTRGKLSANRRAEAIRHAVRTIVSHAGATRLLVACSGGPDSVCLLDVVAGVAQEQGWQVRVGHVRHRVRADDGVDASIAWAHAERLGLIYEEESLTSVNDASPAATSEGILREGRYQALAVMAARGACDAILTGHTLDDQAETVLLHLFRGAGLDGLTGMAAIGPLPIQSNPHSMRGIAHTAYTQAILIRPLLGVRRMDLRAYCGEHGLRVAHDASNDDDRYARNWLRHAVMPRIEERFGDVPPRLARSMETLAADADFMCKQTDDALARCVVRAHDSCVVLGAALFQQEHAAIQRRVVRRQLERLTGGVPSADDVERFRRVALGRSSSIVRFGKLAACLTGGEFIVGEPGGVVDAVLIAAQGRHPIFQGSMPVVIGVPVTLAAPEAGRTAYTLRIDALDTDTRAIPKDKGAVPLCLPAAPTVILRNRAAGDQFHPGGRAHPMRLQDYLTNQRVPASVRDRLPLLVVDGTIAWVMGYDISAPFQCPPSVATHVAVLTTRPS